VCGRKNYRLQDIQLSKSPIAIRGDLVISRVGEFVNEIRQLAKSPTIRSQSGGEYRARTGDLLVANQALSQLS
jgi:hypothetical protein